MLLLTMIFCHIVDDYYLQGILASMKQRDWWKKNSPDALYRYDYLMALLMHSLSWSFMIMFPVAFSLSSVEPLFYAVFAGNVLIHFITDHLKANLKKINLITDQTVHMAQILITWALLH